MECGPICWRNRYRQGKRWVLELCLVEARWLDSMTAREEMRVVVVHDACAPVRREFDAVLVVNLLFDAVHAVAVPRDRELGVFVLGERQTNVQDHCYWCTIQELHARRLAMEKEWQEGIQTANED